MFILWYPKNEKITIKHQTYLYQRRIVKIVRKRIWTKGCTYWSWSDTGTWRGGDTKGYPPTMRYYLYTSILTAHQRVLVIVVSHYYIDTLLLLYEGTCQGQWFLVKRFLFTKIIEQYLYIMYKL